MNNFILVHPNNKLTRVNNFTIPNLESYKTSIESQLRELKNPSSTEAKAYLKNIDKGRLERLINFKNSELKYISSYLVILKDLESICKTCQVEGCKDYDYEKEDEILNKIEQEMKVFRKLETELAKNKYIFETDGKTPLSSSSADDEADGFIRKESLVNLQNQVEHISI